MRLVLVLLVLAACGSTNALEPDAGAGPDAPPGAVDAGPGPDAPPAADPTAARAVLSGAGTVSGGGLTLDVQIGQVFVPRPMSGGDTTLTPSEPIQP